MTRLVPIAITILKHQAGYLFIQRRKPPYEGLWGLIGGKIDLGEHIKEAALREVQEETGTDGISDYVYRGLVSERLVDSVGTLKSHFLIFVGFARIADYHHSSREGEIRCFDTREILSSTEAFIPSDWYMFKSFELDLDSGVPYEAELVQDGAGYHLNYYRKAYE
ncbi:NUDIX domain-containing protein [Candidatus Thorarchaeota archaeon]|nr:MAG: NUDIX domain-containing protein [Candidatus Thorarchaeota archaeon]